MTLCIRSVLYNLIDFYSDVFPKLNHYLLISKSICFGLFVSKIIVTTVLCCLVKFVLSIRVVLCREIHVSLTHCVQSAKYLKSLLYFPNKSSENAKLACSILLQKQQNI